MYLSGVRRAVRTLIDVQPTACGWCCTPLLRRRRISAGDVVVTVEEAWPLEVVDVMTPSSP